MTNTIKIADQVFTKIQEKFMSLEMRIHTDDPVDLSMDILKQEGLMFDVYLKLRNEDELHLEAGYFGGEWFPCTEEEKVMEYFKVVSGLLCGEYRIVEYYQGDKPVKAELQAPGRSGWKTLSLRYSLSFPLPWLPKTVKVLQNKKTETNTADINRTQ